MDTVPDNVRGPLKRIRKVSQRIYRPDAVYRDKGEKVRYAIKRT